VRNITLNTADGMNRKEINRADVDSRATNTRT
jgi:hypothetical protein